MNYGSICNIHYRTIIRLRHAEQAGFPLFTPYFELTDEQRRMLWEGTPYFEGINGFFRMLEENQYKIQYRVMVKRRL